MDYTIAAIITISGLTTPILLAGLPGLALPIGLSSNGLPLGLQIQQAALAIHHIVAVTLQFDGIGLAGGDFSLEPVEIAFVAREYLDEVRARHVGVARAQLHDLALVPADALAIGPVTEDPCGTAISSSAPLPRSWC